MDSRPDPARKTVTPDANASPGESSDVFQMLWDCRFCHTKKLLGLDHRHCPNCGAPQNPEWRYFPSEADIKFVTDKDYSYAGADKLCPFCQQPNSAAANFCVSCGGDLLNAQAVSLKGKMDAKAAASQVDDVVKQKYERDLGIAPDQQQQKAGGFRAMLPLLIIAGLIIACIAGFIYLSSSTVDSRVEVTTVSWSTGVTMQQLIPRAGSDWRDSVPGGAYNVSCRPQQRAYTESVQVQCGFDLVDQGDGTGRRVPKYCTETQTRYKSDQMCSYTVDVWVTIQDITATGGLNDPIATPAFSPAAGMGRIRRTGEFVILRVIMRDLQSGQEYEYNPSTEAQWRTFAPSQRYTVKINRLGAVQWDSLAVLRE